MNIHKDSFFKEMTNKKTLLIIIGVIILCGLVFIFLVSENARELITGFLGVEEAADLTPPSEVTNFEARAGNGQVSLSWGNPVDSDFVGTKVCYSTTVYPTESTTCSVACLRTASPGSDDSCVHVELTNGLTYYYTAFAYDGAANYSAAVPNAQDSAIPRASITINMLSLKAEPEGKTDFSTSLTVYILTPGTDTVVYQYTGGSTSLGDLDINIPPGAVSKGIYDLEVVVPHYLSKKITNVTWPIGLEIKFEDIPAGNLQDADNLIDESDWDIMADQWHTADPVADINQDGQVNSLDWHYLNKNWGFTGD